MTTTIAVNLHKLSCNWCDEGDVPAPHRITDHGWVDYACTLHARKYFPQMFAPAEPGGLKRFEVTFTKAGEQSVHTHTWAKSYEDAYTRTEHFKAKYADVYTGWAFDVAEKHTAIAPEMN